MSAHRAFNVATETPVIFRKQRGEVVAYLPSLPANHGRIVNYVHVGQHGEADTEFYRSGKAATETEYMPLLSELRQIYETGDSPTKLVVRTRDSDLCRWLRYEHKTA